MTNVNRPVSLENFIAKDDTKNTIRFAIAAAKKKGSSFPHAIITGNAGVGKTTLANIIANEMGVKIRVLMGPSVKDTRDISNIFVDKEGDLIRDGDIIFVDEIHSLKKEFQEMFYSAMEDRFIPVKVDDRTFNYKIKDLTIIIATNESSNLPSPLVDRCRVKINLDAYSVSDLTKIITENAIVMNVSDKEKVMVSEEAARTLAGVCRGTPRIAINNFILVRDYAIAIGEDTITKDVLKAALSMMGVDEYGLKEIDRKVLHVLFNVKKMSKDTLASMIGYNPDILVRDIEPYLMIQGLMMRSSVVRTLTEKGWTMIADGLI